MCDATGYAYALLAEMESDEPYMHVTSVFAPEQVLVAFETITGFSLLGYRFANDPALALTTPPTEIFTHLSDFRPEIPHAAGAGLGQAMGLRHVVAIRQQIADQYLGAVSFIATSDEADLEMLEYLCNNHLVYPLRLMREQVHRANLEVQRNAEIVSLARFPEENPSPVMRILADGSFQYVNRPGAQMLAAAGWKSEGLCPVEWRPTIAQALRTGKPVEIEYLAGPRFLPANSRRCLRVIWQDLAMVKAMSISTPWRSPSARACKSSWLPARCSKAQFLESALDCIISIDHEGNVVEWNPAAERTFGYERARVLGRPMHEFIVPHHMRPLHQAGMEHYLRTGHGPVLGKRIEITGLHASGVEFPVELAITPLVLDGTPVFTAYLRDISERKRAEEAIKRSNDLLQAVSRAQSQFILDASPTALFDDILGDLLTLTQSAYGFVGEVLHTSEGQPYLRTHAITDIAWNEETHRLYEDFAPNMEFFNMKTLFGAAMTTEQPVIANDPANDPRSGGLPKGHPGMGCFLGLPLRYGDEMVGLIGLSNRPGGYDEEIVSFLQPLMLACGNLIEAYRNARRRLAAEEETSRLATALKSTEEAIMITALDGTIQDVNPAFERLTGYIRAEAIGQNPRILRSGQHEAGFYQKMWETLLSGEVWHGAFTNKRKDGTLYFVEETISPVRDDVR